MAEVPRIVRAYGIPFPLGNPWLTKEKEAELRMAVFQKALEALQTAPDKPTIFWPNYGNVLD